MGPLTEINPLTYTSWIWLGFLAGLNLNGLLKCTVVQTFLTQVPWVPYEIFFWTFLAFWVALANEVKEEYVEIAEAETDIEV